MDLNDSKTGCAVTKSTTTILLPSPRLLDTDQRLMLPTIVKLCAQSMRILSTRRCKTTSKAPAKFSSRHSQAVVLELFSAKNDTTTILLAIKIYFDVEWRKNNVEIALQDGMANSKTIQNGLAFAGQKIRHRGFPCHLCPQYWSGPIQLNFRDRTGSGVVWMV